jgi:glucan endo-1,3-beta-D-glucosidase
LHLVLILFILLSFLKFRWLRVLYHFHPITNMRCFTLLALVASSSLVSAAFKGFNYGSTFTNGAAKQQTDFESAFKAAKSLQGAPGYTSARLFTTIQGGTANTPISAIPAALNTDTTLLLGLWCSAGDAVFDSELTALKNAISQYGQPFVDKIAAISVGSEDLYRASPIGAQNKENPGAQPDVIARYIGAVRSALASTIASKIPIGHVDTWTAWVDSANKAVINTCDFIGMDAYPYFQYTMANSIDNANATFWDAYRATQAASVGKPVWITETGWPVAGPTSGQAVPGIQNAQRYWKEVQCSATAAGVNTWWYTLSDGPSSPSFSVLGGNEGKAFDAMPLFNLAC